MCGLIGVRGLGFYGCVPRRGRMGRRSRIFEDGEMAGSWGKALELPAAELLCPTAARRPVPRRRAGVKTKGRAEHRTLGFAPGPNRTAQLTSSRYSPVHGTQCHCPPRMHLWQMKTGSVLSSPNLSRCAGGRVPSWVHRGTIRGRSHHSRTTIDPRTLISVEEGRSWASQARGRQCGDLLRGVGPSGRYFVPVFACAGVYAVSRIKTARRSWRRCTRGATGAEWSK